jgi:hypothetical protein
MLREWIAPGPHQQKSQLSKSLNKISKKNENSKKAHIFSIDFPRLRLLSIPQLLFIHGVTLLMKFILINREKL